MSAQVINGKELVSSIREEIRSDAAALTAQGNQPGLVVVIVGEDAASQVYVRNKAKACDDVGIYSEVHRLPEQTTQAELIALIHGFNNNNRD